MKKIKVLFATAVDCARAFYLLILVRFAERPSYLYMALGLGLMVFYIFGIIPLLALALLAWGISNFVKENND